MGRRRARRCGVGARVYRGSPEAHWYSFRAIRRYHDTPIGSSRPPRGIIRAGGLGHLIAEAGRAWRTRTGERAPGSSRIPAMVVPDPRDPLSGRTGERAAPDALAWLRSGRSGAQNRRRGPMPGSLIRWFARSVGERPDASTFKLRASDVSARPVGASADEGRPPIRPTRGTRRSDRRGALADPQPTRVLADPTDGRLFLARLFRPDVDGGERAARAGDELLDPQLGLGQQS